MAEVVANKTSVLIDTTGKFDSVKNVNTWSNGVHYQYIQCRPIYIYIYCCVLAAVKYVLVGIDTAGNTTLVIDSFT